MQRWYSKMAAGLLDNLWSSFFVARLNEEVEARQNRLAEAERAQRYYFDASEAEQWMGEQELYMMSEEKAKVDTAVKHFAPYIIHCDMICTSIQSHDLELL